MDKRIAWIRWGDLVAPTINKLSLFSNFLALGSWGKTQSHWEAKTFDLVHTVVAKDGIVQSPESFKGWTLQETYDYLEEDYRMLWAWDSKVMPFHLNGELVEIAQTSGIGWTVEASEPVLKALKLQPIGQDIWQLILNYLQEHWDYYQDPFKKFSLSMVLNQPYTLLMMVEESKSMACPLPEGRSKATVLGFWKALRGQLADELAFAREWQIRLAWHQKYVEKHKIKMARKESRTRLLAQNVLYRVQNQFVEVHPWKSF